MNKFMTEEEAIFNLGNVSGNDSYEDFYLIGRLIAEIYEGFENRELKDIFDNGSYTVDEVVDAFGLEEVANYINGLGER